ncbi:MAG: prepilin-type N-terminal cleavage/methylation domain-containing protein [Patescibacteria group bacterium]
MKYQPSRKIEENSGFSLVETLVAITILLLVIIGPLTISSSSVRSSAFASEQVTAFFLAQEGAELALKGRDDLLLEYFWLIPSPPGTAPSNPDPWTDFKRITSGAQFANCYGAAGCGMYINTNGSLSSATTCSTIANCQLYLDKNPSVVRSRYTHNNTVGTTPTPFTRVIKFATVGLNEVSVTSTVTWQSGFSRDQQQVVVQTSIFNVYGTN